VPEALAPKVLFEVPMPKASVIDVSEMLMGMRLFRENCLISSRAVSFSLLIKEASSLFQVCRGASHECGCVILPSGLVLVELDLNGFKLLKAFWTISA
jgi:hypothetical protein